MGPGAISTGLAAMATFGFVMAVDRKKRPETVGVAAFLVMTWSLTMAAHTLGVPPLNIMWGQFLDGALAVLLYRSFLNERARWKVGVLFLLAVQFPINFYYQVAWKHPIAYNACVLALNLTFFAQLACVLFPGARDVITSLDQRRFWLGNDSRVRGSP
jgi:hypothetical protein